MEKGREITGSLENQIYNMFLKAGIRGQQQEVRFESSLQATSQQFPFATLANQTLVSCTETRIQINDAFLATKVGLFIKKAGTSATPSALTDQDHAVAKLHTVPTSTVFTAANEAANLMAIFNGSLNMTIDRNVYWDKYPLMRFRRVGYSQQGVLIFTASNTPDSQWEGSDYGFNAMTPCVLMNGQGTNTLTVNLPAGGFSLAGTSSSNFLVLRFGGFLFQNAALAFKSKKFVQMVKQITGDKPQQAA